MRLLVNYSSGSWGIGFGYNAPLFIDNEKAEQFSFKEVLRKWVLAKATTLKLY